MAQSHQQQMTLKISTSSYLKIISIFILNSLCFQLNAQEKDSSFITRIPVDTSSSTLNMDAVYNRPFIGMKKAPLAMGGYLEANSIYSSSDGVTEGLNFQARRLTIFMSATISKPIKLLSYIVIGFIRWSAICHNCQ